MALGSFYFQKWDSMIGIKPKYFKIKGYQKGFIQDFEIYQSIEVKTDLEQVSYVLPTDNKLCIYSMKFQIDDDIIMAEIKTNNEANEIYEQAKKMKKSAALAKQIGPDLISINIGNVPKNTNVAIILKCAFISTLRDPTSILTKIPLRICQFDGTMKDLFKIPSVEIDFEMKFSHLNKISGVVTNCESKYERIDDYNGKLSFNTPFMNESNILIITNFAEKIESQIIQTKKASIISYFPDFKPKINTSKEYIFLVDCSTSMVGRPIKRAKESLLTYLSKLTDECYFNIILFGSFYKKLFNYSSIYNKDNYEKAISFITNEMKANFGASDMLSMLNELFNNERKSGLQRQLVLISDGDVYQREEVVSLIKKNSSYGRIFAIGLGLGADGGFLNEIAEITNGKSDYVFTKKDLPEKINQHLMLSQIDPATNVDIHISGEDSYQVSPTQFSRLFPNVQQNIFIVGENTCQNDVMITINVYDKEDQKQDEVENIISLKEYWDSPAIFALFAHNQLKESQDDIEKSIRISLESGVLSKYTSYVAVSRISYIQNPQEEEETHYRGVIEDHECNEYSESEMILQLLKDNIILWKSEMIDELRKCYEILEIDEDPDIFKQKDPPNKNDESDFSKNDISILDIMKLQKIDGFWDLPSSFVYEKTGGKMPEIDIDFSELSPIIKKRIISTIFCLCYLTKFDIEGINKWNFEKEKSLKWLKKINSTLDWQSVIDNNIPNIIK